MSSHGAQDSGKSFAGADVYDRLDWLPGGGLNIAHEAIVRHAAGSRADAVALVWMGRAASGRSTRSPICRD